MKKLKYIYSAVLITGILCLSGCGSDDDPSAQELAFEKLEGTWSLANGGSVVIDGQDASLNFAGFSFSFADGTYNTSNAGDLFRATGTWSWQDQQAQRITIDDGKSITITTLTEQQFVFSFTSGGTGGVANSGEGIAGNYTITVNK